VCGPADSAHCLTCAGPADGTTPTAAGRRRRVPCASRTSRYLTVARACLPDNGTQLQRRLRAALIKRWVGNSSSTSHDTMEVYVALSPYSNKLLTSTNHSCNQNNTAVPSYPTNCLLRTDQPEQHLNFWLPTHRRRSCWRCGGSTCAGCTASTRTAAKSTWRPSPCWWVPAPLCCNGCDVVATLFTSHIACASARQQAQQGRGHKRWR
jgi:hypothetical protein